MKKKLVGFSVLAAALTMATGMTSFAAGWKQDTNGWYYEYDNGLYLFNPGSVTISPATLTTCYGIVDFSGNRPVFEHREIDVLKRD